MNRIATILGSSAAAAAILLTGSVAFAQSTQQGAQGSWGMRAGQHRGAPGVFGTVSAISGATLTVTSKGFGPNAATSTYTVNAANATVVKGGATSSLGNIAVGDTVAVQGSVSGTNVTATVIRDGVPMGRGMMGRGKSGDTEQPRATIQGNGQPVIGGTVSAISGSTLTVGTKAGATYSVDASKATVLKGDATSSLASITVGDAIIVQGSVNGTSVAATSLIDHGAAGADAPVGDDAPRGMGGLLGGIGGLFHRLFGFF
jgi:hypothetical protein